MVTVAEIISQTTFDDVFAEYKKHYEEKHRTKVMNIFQKLKETHSSINYNNMVLFIRAVKENEFGDDAEVETFDCDDKSILFDVCGIADDYEGLYSIASSTYEDLLSFYVSDDTLIKFNFVQVVSHILWALDW